MQLVRERVVEISQRGGGIAPDALAAVLFGLQMTRLGTDLWKQVNTGVLLFGNSSLVS